MKSIGKVYSNLSMEDPDNKDMMAFMTLHAKGNVLQIGSGNNPATCALLYGVETHGGLLWLLENEPSAAYIFEEHEQFVWINSGADDHAATILCGVPLELNLLFIQPCRGMVDLKLLMRLYGDSVSTSGLIIVEGVRRDDSINQACEEYAKVRGMKYHVRATTGGLGVIFFPEHKEVVNNV